MPVTLKLPGSQFDALDRQAQRERCSVPDLIRRRLALDDDDSDEE